MWHPGLCILDRFHSLSRHTLTLKSAAPVSSQSKIYKNKNHKNSAWSNLTYLSSKECLFQIIVWMPLSFIFHLRQIRHAPCTRGIHRRNSRTLVWYDEQVHSRSLVPCVLLKVGGEKINPGCFFDRSSWQDREDAEFPPAPSPTSPRSLTGTPDADSCLCHQEAHRAHSGHLLTAAVVTGKVTAILPAGSMGF